jgi:hypothetical protein
VQYSSKYISSTTFHPKVDEYPTCQQGWEKKGKGLRLEVWSSSRKLGFLSCHKTLKKNKEKGTYLVLLCFCACIHIKTLTWVIKAYDTKRQVDVRTGVLKNRIPWPSINKEKKGITSLLTYLLTHLQTLIIWVYNAIA